MPKAAGSLPNLVTWQIAGSEQLEAPRSARNIDNQANGGGGTPHPYLPKGLAMSDTTVTDETATNQAEPANAATPDLPDWAVIVDEPLPPAIRGLDGPTMTLANVAATDGKARVSPLDKEDTLRAMSRYLDSRGLRVKYQLHGNGSALIWQVVPKATRTITDEHRAKMAAAAEKRKAANAAARAKLLAQAKKLGIPSPDELPTKQLRERVEKAGS